MVEMPKFVGSILSYLLIFKILIYATKTFFLSNLASFYDFFQSFTISFQSFMDWVHESIGLKSINLGYGLIPWSECVNLYVKT
jgi:hypothetical protein